MRSATYVQAGQTLVCAGCHERKGRAVPPPAAAGLAFGQEPARLAPEPDGSNPLSFPRLVQPVLDRHCVRCHSAGPDPPDLRRGDWQRDPFQWFQSYRACSRLPFTSARRNDRIANQYDRWQPARTVPGQFGGGRRSCCRCWTAAITTCG